MDMGSRPPALTRISPAREFPLQLLVLGSWMLAFGAAAVLEYAPNASLWFPPAAVTFAAVLVLGVRSLPVIWLGCLVVTILANQIHQRELSWPELLLAGLAFGLTHTLPYGGLAMLLRTAARHYSPMATLYRVNVFLVGGIVAAGLSSLLGGLSLAATGMVELAAIPGLISPWWIGDYAGLITFGPLLALVMARVSEYLQLPLPQGFRQLLEVPQGHRSWTVALGKLAALGLVTATVLALAWAAPAHTAVLFLLFMCLPLQLWIVHSENTPASLLGILLFSLLIATAASLTPLGSQALILQFVVLSLAISSYLGLAVPALYRDNHRMRQLVTHDQLTGALSRSLFEDEAREGLQQCEYLATPACLVMIDLDNLKQINDGYGHAAGDRALKHFAAMCSSQLAPGQLLGRLGGDEFAVFVPEKERSQAAALVAAIAQTLELQPIPELGQHAAASFGIAEFTPGAGAADFDQMLESADRNMYRNKLRDKRGAPVPA